MKQKDISLIEIERWRILRELERNKQPDWWNTSWVRYTGHIIVIDDREIYIHHELVDEDKEEMIDNCFARIDDISDDWHISVEIGFPLEVKDFDLWKLCEGSLQKYSPDKKEDIEDAKDEIAAKIAEILFAALPKLKGVDEPCQEPTVFHKSKGKQLEFNF